MSPRDDDAELEAERLLARDARTTWHPYTPHGADPAPLPVVAAHGAELELAGGRTVIDAISSWWTCLHGHGEPELVAALGEQAARLDHVLFAGATHEPAVALAEALLDAFRAALAPPARGPRLERVFFSDDGSTAVEVALKIVRHSWVERREPARRLFVALEGGYHGDTFGAMSVGDPDPFFAAYRPLLFPVRRVAPQGAALRDALAQLGGEAAGVIVEPLVQGAAGMRMHEASFLREARAACDAAGVPLIADEVMTGFGRTGALFACASAGVAPDLLCLAKGLTNGMVALAATLASAQLFESFASFARPDRGRFLPHGHSMTANPIGCAVALRSLALARAREVPARLAAIGARIERALAPLSRDPRVRGLRRTGGIVAFDLVRPSGSSGSTSSYVTPLAPKLRARAVELGVLLRPLGNVVYALPPAATSDAQCDAIAAAMRALVEVE
jgi:adenosylmethionine-8-amino-7-oxononanoate aminotransferase